jgi:wyosine [tRNA(Phe)-imidazoG37] synthetase (radical SAM superfamily)
MPSHYKYIFGPVPSWRLGSSLGVDLLSQEEKICNFDCIYCQVGRTIKHSIKRKEYFPIKEIIEELKTLPKIPIDYITFSGRGEPTLAANLGDAIRTIKSIRKEKVAVLTNSALMDKKDVRAELALADFVIAKLDACSDSRLHKINRPSVNIKFNEIIEGIKIFKKSYKTKLALQIMFIDDDKDSVNKLIALVNQLFPDEVQINTPLRDCSVKPLSKKKLLEIKKEFSSKCKGVNIVSVYDHRSLKSVTSISNVDTLKRRGKI